VAGRASALAIEFIHVTAHREGKRVLDDLTLAVRRGSTVALLGPSRAGKSTAIEIALAIRDVEGGVVRILGMEPGIAVASGRLGALLPLRHPGGTRAFELLQLFRALHDAPLPLDDLVDRAGLASFLNRATDRLSTSEAQQLRFALALSGDPDVLLLDEPFHGLDAGAREALGRNLERLRTEGRTVLLATRDGEVAASSADRVLLIEGGRLTGEADPDVTRSRRMSASRSVAVRGDVR
jgi:ABC-2 type transport system ATP-binding protein